MKSGNPIESFELEMLEERQLLSVTFNTSTDLQLTENNSFVTLISASDDVNTESNITFEITGGADAAAFELRGGLFQFVSPPDFENPTDLAGANAGDNIYEVEITATSTTEEPFGEEQATELFSVEVTDEAIDVDSKRFNIIENQIADLELSATDEGVQLTNFEIVGGADANLFEIVDGRFLRQLSTFDFENPIDDGQDNNYNVEVVAVNSDGVRSEATEQIINVDDVSFVDLEEGVLFIDGIFGNDNFSVELDGETILVTTPIFIPDPIVENASQTNDVTFIFDAQGVEQILVNLGGGDDLLTISDSITVPVEIIAGQGFDTIFGGNGDTVVFDQDAGNIQLGDGDDTVILAFGEIDVANASSNIAVPSALRVDFGQGDDAFDNFGSEPNFDLRLLNLDGFNVFYTEETNSLRMRQVEVQSENVFLTQQRGVFSFSITDEPEQENFISSSVDNFRIDRIDFGGTDIFAREIFVEGSLHFGLSKGYGDVNLELVSGLNIRVLGAVGNNTAVFDGVFAQNNLLVDLGFNFDVIEMPCVLGDVDTGGNFVVRNVNNFIAAPTIVEGNFIFDTRLENIPSVFDLDGVGSVGGNLIYNGGRSADQALLNNGQRVSGNVYVFLGGGERNSSTPQLANLDLNVLGSVFVNGGESSIGSSVQVDGEIEGDLYVSFGKSAFETFTRISADVEGSALTFIGSSATDVLTIDGQGADAQLTVNLRSGDDEANIFGSYLAGQADGGFGDDSLIRSAVPQFLLDVINFEAEETLNN